MFFQWLSIPEHQFGPGTLVHLAYPAALAKETRMAKERVSVYCVRRFPCAGAFEVKLNLCIRLLGLNNILAFRLFLLPLSLAHPLSLLPVWVAPGSIALLS